MSLYPGGQALMTRLAAKYGSDAVYIQPGATTGPAWNPTPGTPVEHTVKAFKSTQRDKEKYIAGGLIQQSDLMLTVEVFAATPALDGAMRVGGKVYQVILVDPATIDPQFPVRWFIGLRA